MADKNLNFKIWMNEYIQLTQTEKKYYYMEAPKLKKKKNDVRNIAKYLQTNVLSVTKRIV